MPPSPTWMLPPALVALPWLVPPAFEVPPAGSLAAPDCPLPPLPAPAGAVALPGEAVYCLGKAAVAHMTKCFAVEWGKNNVRVNCVAPTFFETDGTEGMLGDKAFRADVIERIAGLHRIGQPREVADAVVFLASDAASMITGHTLMIDGGWTAR